MQLEEMQQQWQRLEHKLDQTLAMESQLLRRLTVQPARRRINRMIVWPAIDIGFCLGVLLLAGSFLGDHWPEWQFVLPAATVMVATILLLIDSLHQLIRLSEIDWSGPVAQIQRAISRMRIARIRQFKWIMLLSPLVGFSLLMVALQWLFDRLTDQTVNIVGQFDLKWVIANYLFGILFIPLGHGVARMLSRRFQGRRFWQNILDDVSGASLKAVSRDLADWASLQNEHGPAKN